MKWEIEHPEDDDEDDAMVVKSISFFIEYLSFDAILGQFVLLLSLLALPSKRTHRSIYLLGDYLLEFLL